MPAAARRAVGVARSRSPSLRDAGASASTCRSPPCRSWGFLRAWTRGRTTRASVVARGAPPRRAVLGGEERRRALRAPPDVVRLQFHSRQEWPLAIADVEVRYDATLTPHLGLEAHDHRRVAARRRQRRHPPLRASDRGGVHQAARRRREASRSRNCCPGGRMTVPAGARAGAMVGPGRGVITAWLKRAKLPVGGKTEELVLDFRGHARVPRGSGRSSATPTSTSRRSGRTVRVYTFFGQGDGVRRRRRRRHRRPRRDAPERSPSRPPSPRPLPTYGGADPVHTP